MLDPTRPCAKSNRRPSAAARATRCFSFWAAREAPMREAVSSVCFWMSILMLFLCVLVSTFCWEREKEEGGFWLVKGGERERQNRLLELTLHWEGDGCSRVCA